MNVIAIDTETTGLDVYKGASPFLFLGYNGVDYIASKNKEDIRQVCEDENTIKIFHNAKFDIKMLNSVGISVKGIFYDTMIASHLLDENRPSHALKELARTLLHESTNEEKALEQYFKDHKILKKDREYSTLPDDILIEYGKKDVLYTYNLWQIFEAQLKEQNLWGVFNTECKLVRVLVSMENRGVLIDKQATIDLKNVLEARIKEIHHTIITMYGSSFNVNSSKQLGEILVRDGVKVFRTEKLNIKTDEASLSKYEHPLCKLITEMRKKEKLKTTYCKGLLEAMDDKNVVHCDYRQTGARTGRFSSANPNLQNIPRPDESKSDEAKMIRSLFAVRPGYTNYYFDYSQIEYRIAADYSQDEELIAKINSGADLHTIQAQRIFQREEISKSDRTIAKTVNFAILYGTGVKSLAELLRKSEDEAQIIFDAFMHMNPYIKNLRQEINRAIYKRGYVFNKFGRRRRLFPSEAYKALNALCQGLAADIAKVAMVRIHNLLQNTKSNILMNVHDEVCIEIFNGEEYLVPQIKHAMEDFGDLFIVKIKVDYGFSTTNWAEKQEVA